MKYYDITERSEFYLKIVECTDVTKLSDSFITSDQMGGNEHRIRYNIWYLGEKIRPILQRWADMVQEGKASCRSMTHEISNLMYEVNDIHILNHFQPEGYTVYSDRIYHDRTFRDNKHAKHEREQKEAIDKQVLRDAAPYERSEEVITQDIHAFYMCASNAIESKYNIRRVQIDTFNKSGTIYVKKLINWQELRATAKALLATKQYPQDIKFLKIIWDDPEVLNRKIHNF